jgi:muconate cycloisomerase
MSRPETSNDEDHRAAEIVSIETFPVRLPLRKPLVMSTYRLDDGPALLVRLRAKSGAEGWGEAAASPVMAGETLRGMQAAVEQFATPRLLGRSAFDRVGLMRSIRTGVFANGGAFAAVDIALLDLVGRIRNVPAVELLGGAHSRSVEPLWLIGGSGSPEKDVEDALALRDKRFRQFKLKVGVGTVSEELRTVRLLREALGEKCLIAADANMGWDVQTAVRFARGAAEFGLAFLEQPVAAGDLPRMTLVAAASPVPIGIDESMHGPQDILAYHQAGAIGGASLKTIKLGGVTPLVSLGATCHTLGLSLNLAMMMESSIASAAMIHAACALPQVAWGLSLGNLWLAEEPVREPISCVDGLAFCPAGPGLGVEVDERRISALAAA